MKPISTCITMLQAITYPPDVTCMYSQVCIQGDVLSPMDIVRHSRSSETTCYRHCAFVTYATDEILF
jgi:hypothetical protein